VGLRAVLDDLKIFRPQGLELRPLVPYPFAISTVLSRIYGNAWPEQNSGRFSVGFLSHFRQIQGKYI
jgi:hypothetical protein